MYEKNTEQMIQAPFKINPELEAVVPPLTKEKSDSLEASLRSIGQQNPIQVMPDKTIIDGHNRYHLLKKIGKKEYQIDFVVLPINQIQEAKEYSIEMNLKRRQLNTYLTATWALGVYGQFYNEDQIAKKVGLSRKTINDVKNLNLKCEKMPMTPKLFKLKSELISGDISASSVLSQLTSAENIDNIIAVVDTRLTPKIGKEKAKQFKAKLEAEYVEKKYDKKSLKAINTQIDKIENPQRYAPIDEDDFSIAVEKVTPKLNDLKARFPEQTLIYLVTTEEGFLETGQAIKDLACKKKLYAIVCLLELPKGLVPEKEEGYSRPKEDPAELMRKEQEENRQANIETLVYRKYPREIAEGYTSEQLAEELQKNTEYEAES